MKKVCWSLLILSLFFSRPLCAQDSSQAFDFWVSDALMKRFASENTIMFSMTAAVKARNAEPHGLKEDCEMHLASKPTSDKAWPAAVVFEPPNLCKQTPADLPSNGTGFTSWQALFDDVAIGHECTAVGFPRLFDEHLESNAGPSSPGHFLEIHPALKLECDGKTLDFRSFLKYHEGMKRSLDSTIARCLEKKKLYVRKTVKNGNSRWEFQVQGGGSCGNFALVSDAMINAEWVRKVNGGHSALARVTIDDQGPFTLKLYTYDETPEDQLLAGMKTDDAQQVTLHGMLTYDYFSILKTIRTPAKAWKNVTAWTEVPFPLALVVFGRADSQ